MNRWDERYSEAGFAYGTEPNDFLVQAAKHLAPGSRILSLAEGEGRNAVYLAKLGHHVTAVDMSEVGLKKAKELATKNGVEIDTALSDVTQYPLGEEKWDAIVSIWCHVLSDERALLHKNAVKALRPGGLLILEAYTPQQLKFRTGGPSELERLATLNALRVELSELKFLHGEELVRDIHEGRLHNGKSAVVQVIAQKRDEKKG